MLSYLWTGVLAGAMDNEWKGSARAKCHITADLALTATGQFLNLA